MATTYLNNLRLGGHHAVVDDAWDDLLDELLPDGEGHVVVLRAYVDASSREVVHPQNGDKGDLITVAGYMFESRQHARRFSQQWRDVFGTESFSWADLIARSKPFKHLRDNRPEHDELVAAGISLVRQFVIAGTVASMWKQDVERHGPIWIAGFGHAYSVAGHMAMVGLGAWAKQNDYRRNGIAYLIEAGDEAYDQLNHLLSYAAKSPDVADMYQWRSHSVLAKLPSSPFHAPDTLAWEWGKYWVETHLEKKRLMRRSFVALLDGRLERYTFQHLYGQHLLRFFSRIRDLGIEQMQQDAQTAASVPSIDVTDLVSSSEQIEHDEDRE
jgi:hypothetical protein